MKRLILATISLTLVISLTLLISGCIFFPEGNKGTYNIESLYVKVPLNSVEVMNINYTAFSRYVTNVSKTLTIGYPNGTIEQKTVYYSIQNDSTEKEINYCIFLEYTMFSCIIYADKTSNKSYLSATSYDTGKYTNEEIEKEKNLLMDGIATIMQGCNLTIDWTKAEWTINYAD